MVTPADKVGGVTAYNTGFQTGLTRDGDHVFFYSQQPIVSNAPASPWVYRADRTEHGWDLTTPLAPPLTTRADVELMGFDDKTLSFLGRTPNQYDPLDTDWPDGFDLYRFDASGNVVGWPSRGEIGNGAGISVWAGLPVASTRDGSHVVFNMGTDVFVDEPALTPNAVGIGVATQPLYESIDGQIQLLGTDDDGHLLATGRIFLGGKTTVGSSVTFGALSRDGRRVFFTATSESGTGDTGREGLYVRTDGTTTTPVPETPAGANARAVFGAATPDGSQVFFFTPDRLTLDDSDDSVDLYRLDLVTHQLTRISAGPVDAGAESGPVWVSDDGSRVYFTATGQLVGGTGSAGGLKTFLWDRGELKFVADAAVIETGNSGGPACSNARATPDGRTFVAATTASLDPADQDNGARDVYWFDAATGKLRLVSTGPADGAGTYDAEIRPAQPWIPERCWDYGPMSHPLSDDGRHVFFQTAESLVPKDVDGKIDVYEWDADSDTVHLLTAGTVSAQYGGDPNIGNSYLLDATPDGHDVFVATQERLVPEDRDEMTDIYDIREGGGFPHATPEPVCQDSGCQGPARSAPGVMAPASATGSAVPSVSQRRRVAAQLTLGRLSAAARRSLARTGRVSLTVRVTTAGRIAVAARARIGRRRQVVGRGSATAPRAGKVRVSLRLTNSARRALHRARRVRVTLTATQTTGAKASTAFTLSAGADR